MQSHEKHPYSTHLNFLNCIKHADLATYYVISDRQRLVHNSTASRDAGHLSSEKRLQERYEQTLVTYHQAVPMAIKHDLA